MFISLWISSPAFGWGELGHRIVAEYGTELASPAALNHCRIDVARVVAHTNDPDRVWRQQRFKHPDEARTHFFHTDRQPSDWRTRTSAKDPTQGRLVYRITSWIEEARLLRKSRSWDELAEHLYGLSHYIGDLSQPLHLNHDYDGEEAGLPDLHSQFETKMLNRFEAGIRAGVARKLTVEKLPAYWAGVNLNGLIFDTAEQSGAKAQRLFAGAKGALILPPVSRRRKHSHRPPEPRFNKKLLWQGTGSLAVEQLAVGARLWAHVVNSVCE